MERVAALHRDSLNCLLNYSPKRRAAGGRAPPRSIVMFIVLKLTEIHAGFVKRFRFFRR